MTTHNEERPAFIIQNNLYVSAGIIFYCKTSDGNIMLMMQDVTHTGEWRDNCLWRWEDFGGKSSREDNSIYEVASREAWEELNYKIKQSTIKKALAKDSTLTILDSSCKYALFLVEVPHCWLDMDLIKFGDREELTGIWRVVRWLSLDDFEQSREHVHPRLSKMMNRICKGLREPKA